MLKRLFYVPIGGLIFSIFLIQACGAKNNEEGSRVCHGERSEHCFQVEVAYKPEDLTRGLMHREHLDENAGMLFVFTENSAHDFWMKNTLIPLDMIWLDYAKRIVHIASDVPPCQADPCPTYGPGENTLYVLEINAGKAQETGLKVGDVLDFKIQQ